MNKKPISQIWDSRGFTLLELIAVMAIIALLASLAVPFFIDLQQRLQPQNGKLFSLRVENQVQAVVRCGSIACPGQIRPYQLGTKFHKL